MNETPRLGIVVPLHDEAANLAPLLAALADALAELGLDWQILLVDDGSGDATWAGIERAAATDARIAGLRLSRNFGKEAALCAGLEHIDADAVIVMDGDLQHPPALIPRMVAAWRDGAQVVEARKSSRGDANLSGRAAAGLFYALFDRLSGFRLTDASDFKLLDRRALEAWRLMPERNLFFRGMSAWLGFERVEIPFDVAPRAGGASGWAPARLARLALTAITAFSSAPLQLVTLAGGAFALFAVALGAQTLYTKASGQAVDGFTTVIVLQLLTGGLILLGLGIVGEYIARIYDETKRRPRYLVSRVVGTRDRSIE